MFKRIKKWFIPNLSTLTWYKYEVDIKFKDDSECKYTTNKYTYLDEDKEDDIISLALLRRKTIKLEEILYNVYDIEKITYSKIDEIKLYYTDDVDVVFTLGELATKEQLEEYNKKVLK